MTWNAAFGTELVSEVLKTTEERFTQGLSRFQGLALSDPDWVKLMVENFDSLCLSLSLPFYISLTGDDAKVFRLGAYHAIYDLEEAIDFLNWFIGHECLDDGSPTLVWLKRSVTEDQNRILKTTWEITPDSGVDHPTPFDTRSHTCVVLRCRPWELDTSGKFDKIGTGLCCLEDWEKVFRYHPSRNESRIQASLKQLIGITP